MSDDTIPFVAFAADDSDGMEAFVQRLHWPDGSPVSEEVRDQFRQAMGLIDPEEEAQS